MQLSDLNEEFLVSASHQLALNLSLPFVHTARRYYRLNGLVRPLDARPRGASPVCCAEAGQTWSFRGSKSRNKVSVGEPAEGSLARLRASQGVSKYAILVLCIHTRECACAFVHACGLRAVRVHNGTRRHSVLHPFFQTFLTSLCLATSINNNRKLPAMDHSVLASMKSVANCEK